MKARPLSGTTIVALWCGKCERMTRHTVEAKPYRATCHVCRSSLSRRARNIAERRRQKRLFE
jgi:hypothetical protein